MSSPAAPPPAAPQVEAPAESRMADVAPPAVQAAATPADDAAAAPAAATADAAGVAGSKRKAEAAAAAPEAAVAAPAASTSAASAAATPANSNKRQKRNDADDGDAEDSSAGGAAGKKRKVALAVMYRGTAYNGLQLQNNVAAAHSHTVERVLLDAILAAGGVTPANYENPSKIKWMRAARTDKGVHAAGNILSLNLVCDGPPPPGCKSQSPDVVERINAELPEDVRAIAAVRTLSSFHAKFACMSRVYEYIIPTFVFDQQPDTKELVRQVGATAPAAATDAAAAAAAPPFTYPDRLLNYRMSQEKLAEVREILSCFKGTHNYQNFTRKKSGFLKEKGKTKARRNDDNKSSATDAAASEASEGKGQGQRQAKRGKKEDDVSDDDRGGLDDAEEEAMERAEFQRQLAAAAPAAATDGASSSTSAAPFVSPFSTADGLGIHRPHHPLYTNLKAANSKDGESQTNKVSGQYARFIRYIIDFDVEEVFLYPPAPTAPQAGAEAAPRSLEFVRIRIHGQSFLLNMIRKMVGIVIAIARGDLPRSYLTEKALKFTEYAVPTAPSLGLLLQRPVYTAYDNKVTGPQATPDRPTIASLFTDEPYRSRVQQFREKFIYGEISHKEMRSASAVHWCSLLHDHPAMMQHQMDEQKEAAEAKDNASAGEAAPSTEAAPAALDAKVEAVQAQ